MAMARYIVTLGMTFEVEIADGLKIELGVVGQEGVQPVLVNLKMPQDVTVLQDTAVMSVKMEPMASEDGDGERVK